MTQSSEAALHVLATDGVFTRDGRFHPVIWPEEAQLEERFRRRFLLLLERAGRLRPETRERSFDRLRTMGSSPGATRASRSRRRSASPPTSAHVSNRACYATRVVLAVGAVKLLDGAASGSRRRPIRGRAGRCW